MMIDDNSSTIVVTESLLVGRFLLDHDRTWEHISIDDVDMTREEVTKADRIVLVHEGRVKVLKDRRAELSVTFEPWTARKED